LAEHMQLDNPTMTRKELESELDFIANDLFRTIEWSSQLHAYPANHLMGACILMELINTCNGDWKDVARRMGAGLKNQQADTRSGDKLISTVLETKVSRRHVLQRIIPTLRVIRFVLLVRFSVAFSRVFKIHIPKMSPLNWFDGEYWQRLRAANKLV